MSNVTFIFYKEEPGWLLLRWKRNISTDKKLQCKSFFIFFFKIRQTSCRTNIKWHTAADNRDNKDNKKRRFNQKPSKTLQMDSTEQQEMPPVPLCHCSTEHKTTSPEAASQIAGLRAAQPMESENPVTGISYSSRGQKGRGSVCPTNGQMPTVTATVATCCLCFNQIY